MQPLKQATTSLRVCIIQCQTMTSFVSSRYGDYETKWATAWIGNWVSSTSTRKVFGQSISWTFTNGSHWAIHLRESTRRNINNMTLPFHARERKYKKYTYKIRINVPNLVSLSSPFGGVERLVSPIPFPIPAIIMIREPQPKLEGLYALVWLELSSCRGIDMRTVPRNILFPTLLQIRIQLDEKPLVLEAIGRESTVLHTPHYFKSSLHHVLNTMLIRKGFQKDVYGCKGIGRKTGSAGLDTSGQC